MSTMDDLQPASEYLHESASKTKPLKLKRCPFLDEKWICKISRDFVEYGKREEVFLCTCSEFYVNCDIYKNNRREPGGEIVE